ncbi:FAD-binding oxidoreductase [Lentzea tibetensis]|uniref:FAD-binding oxidoreductase n=1 Tax=Lentzea tibetensis TaxID=2591470 RepID=A0A563ERT1_9PSEU|nr:FAD-binding protein [Lentzea tibetensis]TWP50386.1 FAD-binding oxidoreductase [Lentzea tibetensis]
MSAGPDSQIAAEFPSTALPASFWSGLAAQLSGELVLPGDPGYVFAKQLQNYEFDAIEPAAVAYCETARDVQACLRFARGHDVRVHIRSGGHSFNGCSTGTGLVIDVSRINHVIAGPTVQLGAGSQSVDVLDALHRQGAQVVTGTFPTVSAGGFLSGGGIGWQTRKFGIGSDRIVSARVVLADGRLVHCSATEEPDLFWAVRGGGGGNFGVVVEFEVRPIEAPLLVGYETTWPISAAAEVMAAWQAWCMDGSEDLGSSLVVLPAFGPDNPPMVKVWGVHLGSRDQLDAALDELAERVGVAPLSRTSSDPAPYGKVMHSQLCGGNGLAECHRTGSNPVAVGHRHPYTRQSYRLIDRALDVQETAEVIQAWDPSLNRERYVLCIAIGGAANRVCRTETAYAHREAQFLIGYQIALRGDDRPAEDVAFMNAWADRADALLTPLSCGAYVNFPSSNPDADWLSECYGENLSRLRRVKRKYDPTGMFQHAQGI